MLIPAEIFLLRGDLTCSTRVQHAFTPQLRAARPVGVPAVTFFGSHATPPSASRRGDPLPSVGPLTAPPQRRRCEVSTPPSQRTSTPRVFFPAVSPGPCSSSERAVSTNPRRLPRARLQNRPRMPPSRAIRIISGEAPPAGGGRAGTTARLIALCWGAQETLDWPKTMTF